MMYCSLAQLKAYTGVTGAGDDTLLTDCIVRAEGIIDSTTGRTFEASTDSTRTFDGEMDVVGRTLYLDADLCAITSITNGDGGAITAGQVVSEPRNTAPYYALTLKASSGLAWTYEDDPEDAWVAGATARHHLPTLNRRACGWRHGCTGGRITAPIWTGRLSALMERRCCPRACRPTWNVS